MRNNSQFHVRSFRKHLEPIIVLRKSMKMCHGDGSENDRMCLVHPELHVTWNLKERCTNKRTASVEFESRIIKLAWIKQE